jgi:hypothetical protein
VGGGWRAAGLISSLWECFRSSNRSVGGGWRAAGPVSNLWECCRFFIRSVGRVGVLQVLYPVCGVGWSVAGPVSGLLEGVGVL